jgi:hypothetical protein
VQGTGGDRKRRRERRPEESSPVVKTLGQEAGTRLLDKKPGHETWTALQGNSGNISISINVVFTMDKIKREVWLSTDYRQLICLFGG